MNIEEAVNYVLNKLKKGKLDIEKINKEKIIQKIEKGIC